MDRLPPVSWVYPAGYYSQTATGYAVFGGVIWVPPPPDPRLTNPFYPYAVPGLPPAHRVWGWLEGIDGGVWEDASIMPNGGDPGFSSMILWYRRVVLRRWDRRGDDPATFGLYPPLGPRPLTVITLSSTSSDPPLDQPAESHPTETEDSAENNLANNSEYSSVYGFVDSSEDDSEDDSGDGSVHSSDDSPEIARGYMARHFDFQDFSDPPSPIRGNFIPVSGATSSPSPSPIQQGDSLSPIQETVTESEEDNLKNLINRGKMQYQRARDAYKQSASTPATRNEDRDNIGSSGRARSRSPAKYGKTTTPSSRSRSSSPVKSSTRRGPRNGHDQPRVSFTFEDSDDYDMSTAVNSPSARDPQLDHGISPCSPTPSLSRRRHMPDLHPINVSVARQEARAEALRKGKSPIAMHVPQKPAAEVKPTQHRAKPTYVGEESSSAYSQDEGRGVGRLSVDPLQATRQPPNNRGHVARQSIFDSYTDWKEGSDNRSSGTQRPADDDDSEFEDDYHSQKKAMETASRKKPAQMTRAQQAGYNGDPYSPLDVMNPEIPVAGTGRMVSKTMFGDKGWLENTTPQKKPTPKKVGFFENLRKKTKELVNIGSDQLDQLKAPRSSNKSRQNLRERQLVISLNPREQSLLYCELEFILTTALSSYINCQFNAGRLSPEKLKRIADGWQQRGRPKVVGFRYDLETQLDLVRMHVGQFRFYSRQVTEAAIFGIIDMMRVNSRAMRIRTYCTPDTVVSKQILDTQALLNVIGCSEDEHVALASVTQFYKDAIAREKVFHYDSGDTVSDSARVRNTDERWEQSREDHRAKTPQNGGGYADYARHQSSRENSSAVSPQNGYRHAEYPRHQSSREDSLVATPHNRRSTRDRARSPGTPWPTGNPVDMMD